MPDIPTCGQTSAIVNLFGGPARAGFRSDGLPLGVTLAAPGFWDAALKPLADRLHRAAVRGAPEITSFGGWRAYIASLGVGQPLPV